MAPCDVSVVIPILNEAETLPALLQDLQRQVDVTIEVLVADGGSEDGSTEIARTFPFARVVSTLRGRGRQMNRGAQEAHGEYLFFLHADTRLRSNTLVASARDAMTAARHDGADHRVAGHFALEFIRKNPDRHPVAFRYAEEKTSFDRPHVVNGDQGLFLHRSFFAELGGFDESFNFLEDQKIAADIRSRGRWLLLPGTMRTSARRFESAGFFRLYTLMSIIVALYWVGATEFFVRAPEVYPKQDDTSKLLLTPFFNTIGRMFRDDYGLAGTLRLLLRIGGFVRSHSWQMFYFADIWLRPVLGPRKYPFLKFHDVVFWPATNYRLFDAIAALGAVLWFFGVLFPVYTILDRRELRDRASVSR
jgi:rSAM/selenodomain-associated transferase 2